MRTIPARAKDAPAGRTEPALGTAVAAPAKLKAEAAKKGAKPAAKDKEEGAALDVDEVAQRLMNRAPGEGGYRALVTAETQGSDTGVDAIALAKALDGAGQQTILIDWSPSGKGMAGAAGVAATVGLTELLTQTAGFEDAVQRMPESNVHLIACGSPLEEVDNLDPDQLNLVLDALDEAYNFIIVTGGHDDCRLLFEVIQGRFDAGILVHDAKKPARVLKDPPGTFLGFEVSDIDVMKMEKKQIVPPVSPQRIMRAVRGNGSELRPN